MIALTFVMVLVGGQSHAAICGDADGNASVSVTDGVQVLRAVAGLGTCPAECDVDGDGVVSVTDGVNVLRVAAGLDASLRCFSDPFISSVQADSGIFGELTKRPAGLVEPEGAVETVTNVSFSESFVKGRVNTITIDYDLSAIVTPASAPTASLIVASAETEEDPSAASFDVPLAAVTGSATVALDLKPDVQVQQFLLRIANGSSGAVAGRIRSILIVVIQAGQPPTCSNRVLDPGETCDPPGFGCAVGTNPGFCNTICECEPFPVRYVDNGDGTVTDTQTDLQWEKKTGTFVNYVNCTNNPCPNVHDVNNSYQWCRNVNGDQECDAAGNPPDGDTFTVFLATLNTPPCFAGHCDWRLPTVNRDGGNRELETIVDLTAPGCGTPAQPCIDPIFGPTAPGYYWSNTTYALQPFAVWSVLFETGFVTFGPKRNDVNARAVRGPIPVEEAAQAPRVSDR